jgi:hypothetical protein
MIISTADGSLTKVTGFSFISIDVSTEIKEEASIGYRFRC